LEDDEEALWTAFKIERSMSAREELFRIYLPFARRLARRRHSTGAKDIEFQDLFQMACAGLLEALDKYDPTTGAHFKSYASRRISGSILDGISKLSEMREQISFRNRMRGERARSLAANQVDTTEVMDALAELVVGLALGFMLEDAGLAASETQPDRHVTGYQSLAWKQTVQRLTDELSKLPERERTVVRGHYLDGLDFEQLAGLLGLSKGRISQVHRSALAMLKRRLPRSVQLLEG
jgi:RNA polymerase sigma factor for flagellar operon FliA